MHQDWRGKAHALYKYTQDALTACSNQHRDHILHLLLVQSTTETPTPMVSVHPWHSTLHTRNCTTGTQTTLARRGVGVRVVVPVIFVEVVEHVLDATFIFAPYQVRLCAPRQQQLSRTFLVVHWAQDHAYLSRQCRVEGLLKQGYASRPCTSRCDLQAL